MKFTVLLCVLKETKFYSIGPWMESVIHKGMATERRITMYVTLIIPTAFTLRLWMTNKYRMRVMNIGKQ